MKNRLTIFFSVFINFKKKFQLKIISHIRPNNLAVGMMNKIPVIIESLCYLLSNLKKADKIHLVKLVYLADKYHLMNYGRTITGDEFIAFRNGPGGSRTTDVLDFDPYVLGEYLDYAHNMFKKSYGYQYMPGAKCRLEDLEMLSQTDIEALEFSIKHFGTMDRWAVVDYTHRLQEWKQFEPLFKEKRIKRELIKIEELLCDPKDEHFSVPPEHINQSLEIIRGTFD